MEKKYADVSCRGLEKSKKWIIQTHHLECKSACSGGPTLPLWTGLGLPSAWGLLLLACKQWCDLERPEVT